MKNDVPLGMGCGSSATGRLAAIALAVHFGELGWTPDRILEEACALEGHPDNAAACWLGGFVVAASEGRSVHLARISSAPQTGERSWCSPRNRWQPVRPAPCFLQATPSADVVANIQAVSLLGLAFAQGRGDLLRVAMEDRIHQPYRSEICPMLPRLLPLAGSYGILGTALSGAGPAVSGHRWR